MGEGGTPWPRSRSLRTSPAGSTRATRTRPCGRCSTTSRPASRFDPEGWTAYVTANRRFRDAVLERLRARRPRLGPRLPADAPAAAHAGRGSRRAHRLLPAHPVPLLRDLPHPARGDEAAARAARRRPGRLPDPRRTSSTSAPRCCGSLGLEQRSGPAYRAGRRDVRLEALPIGIDPRSSRGCIESDDAVRAPLDRAARSGTASRRILLGVDRLDYTKGIPERLRAFERLLAADARAARPGRAGPGGGALARAHRSVRPSCAARSNELVGEINGEFGTPDWTPVVYIRRVPSRSSSWWRSTRRPTSCWVTPLRDGMNLVAKEYVACQRRRRRRAGAERVRGRGRGDGRGPARQPVRRGAHGRGRASAPWRCRPRSAASAWRALHARVMRNDVFAWAERFLGSLDAAAGARGAGRRGAARRSAAGRGAGGLPRGRAPRSSCSTTTARSCPSRRGRRRAARAARCVELLRELARGRPPRRDRLRPAARRPRALVRPRPGPWLAAEHGALVRAPGRPNGSSLRAAPTTPGSSASGPSSTVHRPHSRQLRRGEGARPGLALPAGRPEFGDWLANELVADLDELLAQTELQAVRGNKSSRYATSGPTRARSWTGCAAPGPPPTSGSPSATTAPTRSCSRRCPRTPGRST